MWDADTKIDDKGRAANFTLRDRGVNALLAKCLNNVLNVKALVGAFNQENALVGAFSVILQLEALRNMLQSCLLPSPGLFLSSSCVKKLRANQYSLLTACL